MRCEINKKEGVEFEEAKKGRKGKKNLLLITQHKFSLTEHCVELDMNRLN